MIATLSGVVSEKLTDMVVLDVQGVGYGLFVTAEDHGRLTSSDPARVFIYEHIREQAHDLYAFLSRDTKALFEQLLDVSGIGPKMALNMLSIGTAQEVRRALVALGFTYQDAAKALQTIDVNLSTEERIKLALRGGAR
jgi:Holliday junction DNA helicase RuvA